MVRTRESFYAQMELTVYRFPVACSTSDNRDAIPGYETDSDLEDGEDSEIFEVTGAVTPKSS